jgi:SNF2 family DNA or RNA helicase
VEATFSQKLLAHELTLARPAHDAQKLARSLNSAQVDLNPHQIDAALFAFRSPLSRSAILADEVGLGKTIEAGLIVGQLYAEDKKKILLLLPASIRCLPDRLRSLWWSRQRLDLCLQVSIQKLSANASLLRQDAESLEIRSLRAELIRSFTGGSCDPTSLR